LFAKHPSIENAWFYHSRADSQLILITGKKFDPAPLEAAIATSDLVDDVLIFGNGKPYPGALIIRSAKSSETSNEELLAAVWPSIESLNKESQDHARIPRHMLIAVRHQSEQLQKSSKGTIIRKAAEARFEDHINAAYDLEDDGTGETVDDADIPQHLIGLIPSIVSSTAPLDQDTDLFSYGVDSVACIQLRSRLRQLNSRYNQELPLSVVEDCGTVRGLADYIVRKRHGEGDATAEDQEQLMLDLVKEYSSFTKRGFAGKQSTTGLGTDVSSRDVVVLTGATGALGVHVLDLLRKSGTVSVIYCLVRGADELTATERVSKALEQRGLPGLFSKGNSSNKVRIIRAQLGGPRLGLTSTVYNQLAAEATLILHVAWTVNFRLKLKSFAKDNLAGLKNLIDLALAIPRACPPRLAYCSSTAAIMNGELNKSGYLAESLSQDPASASALGYSRSKWVAEQICAQAHSQTPLQGRVAIIRVGQLSGDSKTGIWNTKEAWPMMLSTARLIGCLPDLSDEPLDWLPVDRAAKAFLEAACVESDRTEQVPVYHVLNPHQQPTWHNMLQWIRRSEKFDIVDPTVWVRRLEHSSHTEHSAMKLLSLWKTTYDSGKSQEMQARPRFSIATTQQQVLALKDIQPLDEVYMWKVWEWVQDNVR
jgi:thioester reductase-like protein